MSGKVRMEGQGSEIFHGLGEGLEDDDDIEMEDTRTHYGFCGDDEDCDEPLDSVKGVSMISAPCVPNRMQKICLSRSGEFTGLVLLFTILQLPSKGEEDQDISNASSWGSEEPGRA